MSARGFVFGNTIARVWPALPRQFILNGAPSIMSRSEARRAHHTAMIYLQTYTYLGECAVAEGRACWKLRPKHHYFVHIIDRILLERQNPCKQLSCAGEETFMGVMKRVGKACHGRTTYLRTLQRCPCPWGVRGREGAGGRGAGGRAGGAGG